MKIFLRLLIALLVVASTVQAQTGGKLKGIVNDAQNNPLVGATVEISGTATKHTKADTSGKYEVELTPGNYTVKISSVSFKTITEKVTIKAGQTETIQSVLKPVEDMLAGVTVSRRKDRESESVLNIERKESNLVIQKIGAKELERKGVSNVAEGVSKVASVSIVGGQQLFIRGLGDRYNNAILNGLPVPSPNPDMKVIPLDIFPAAIVKNLNIVKSYSSDFYGDFSGGTIDIVTKDYPDNKFFKISGTVGMNSLATGKDFFTPVTGASTFSGFTRQNRALPDAVKNQQFYESTKDRGNNVFKVPFSPTKITAPVRMGLNVSGGNYVRYGSGKELGYIFNLSFKNNYQRFTSYDRLLNANEVDLFTNDLVTYRYSTNTSGLVGLYYKMNERNVIKYNLLVVNDSQDEVMDIDGINPDLGPVYTRLSTNIQNTVLLNQLHGRHGIANNWSLNWSASYGSTMGSLPDRTQISMLNSGPGVANRSFFFNKDVLGNNHKFFGELKETEPAVKLEAEFKGKNSGNWSLQQLKVGVDGRYKKRTFEARQIDIRTTAIRHNLNPNNIDTTLTPGRMDDGFSENSWAYVETYYPSNNYNADIALAAPYVFGNWKVSEKVDLLGGLRMEYSDQNINYKQSNDTYDRKLRNYNRKKFDFLPFVTVKYKRSEKNNILFSASRSLTRPLFLELAPFRYNQGFNRLPREGNPFLETSVNYNADLKFELYPTKAELMAITVFGKRIQKPIEQILVISSDRLTSYFNSDEATLFGAELEINRNFGAMLGSSNKFLKNLGIGLNAAYIHSEIKITPSKVNSFYPVAPTNEKRPMFGASPYLVNVDLNYKGRWSSNAFSQATVSYNVYGKRVVFAGSFGSGDVYEMPAPTLDFTLNNQLSKRVNVDLSLGNILNPKIQQKQFFGDKGHVINEFQRGMTASLSVGYLF